MKIRFALAVVLSAALSATAMAGTWSGTADYSLANNPNGAWSYGYETTLGGAFNTFTLQGDGGCGSPYNGWDERTNGQPAYVQGTPPPGAPPCAGYIVIPPADLHLHPGPSGEYAVLRWTAPYAGVFEVFGYFEGINFATTDDHIRINNGSDVFTLNLSDRLNQHNFAFTFNAGPSATLDFLVGDGGNGYSSDSTGLNVTISDTADAPEPSTWMLALVAGLALVPGRYRRAGRLTP